MRDKSICRLMKIANKNYPGELISHYFDYEKGTVRNNSSEADTLALFIAREIHSVFDKQERFNEQCDTVADALHRAMEEIARVANAFSRKARGE